MSRFSVGIVGREINQHTRCFEEFAFSLVEALRALGHDAALLPDPVHSRTPGRLIVLGGNNLSDDPKNPKIPADTIVFNSEQISAVASPEFFLQNYLQFRQMTVWDYAQSNINSLRGLDIRNAVLCPVGYVPSMTTIEPVEEDIDVLFYGSDGGPRRFILDDLEKRTALNVVRVGASNPLYGKERDAVIARAKVIINLHYYTHGVFEIFRVSHLLANKKCVVTEAGGRDAGLEAFAKSACAYVPRDELVDTCRRLVAHTAERRQQAEQGHEAFKKIDLVENVRRALENS